MKTSQKLVRDNIPSLIEKDGKTAKTRILSKEETLIALKTKLLEETNEYLSSEESLEELADIEEVVFALALESGHSLEELEQIRLEKRNRNGAFTKRIFLESVSE